MIGQNFSANNLHDISANTASGVTVIQSAVGSSSGFTLSASSTKNLSFGINLKLGSLQDNGGGIPTHIPDFNSPLLDKGSNSFSLTTDQRGFGTDTVNFPRSKGTTDIGAVEFGTATIPTAAATVTNIGLAEQGQMTYTFTVKYADALGSIDVSTLDNDDILVLGPNGFFVNANFVGVDINTNGSPRIATYSITAPVNDLAGFDNSDTGDYQVFIQDFQVSNTDPLFIEFAQIGQFNVTIPRVFTVTNTNDSGAGSLRQALDDVNNSFSLTTDIVAFDPSFSSSVKTITLTSGQLLISESVMLTGPGADKLTINGNSADRILNINNSSAILNVTISGLGFTGGQVTGSGGAIQTNNEQVTFDGVHIFGNSATSSGGGFATTDGAQITLLNSAITGNVANTSGGGAYINNSAVLVILVRNTTISGNSSGGTTGGGGINFSFATGNSMTIQNSTFTDNIASGSGADGGGIRISSSSGVLSIESTVIANNQSGTGAAFGPDIGIGTSAATVGNLNAKNSAVGDAVGFNKGTDVDNIAPGTPLFLSYFGFNGGPTPTVNFASNSPLLDAGSNSTGQAFDQRGAGFDREVPSGMPDIGAFERVFGAPSSSGGPYVTVNDANKFALDPYFFDVTYSNDVNITFSSLDSNDIRVTGPNGFNTLATFVSASPAADALSITATYKVAAPVGGWTQADNGSFSIAVEGNQVSSTNGKFVPAGTVRTFNVALADLFIVTNINEGGAGSLRDALEKANASPVPSTVIFDPSFSTLVQTLNLAGSELLISDDTTVVGPGADKLTIDAVGQSRVLNISNSSAILDVSISGLGFTGGQISGDGGGIMTNNEIVTLDGVHIFGNSASSDGGGLSTTDGAQVTILNSAITGNTAVASGGGAHFDNSAISVVVIRNSTISNNSMNGTNGGGGINFLYAAGNSITFQNSTITDNTANGAGADGGGIRVSSSLATMSIESTVVANNLSGSGIGFGPDIAMGTSVGTTGTLNATNSAVGTTAGYTKGVNVGNIAPGTPLLLSPLAFNGGPTPSVFFDASSPLLDAGSNPAGLTFDQRGSGFPREAPAGMTDIGALEIDPTIPTVSGGPFVNIDMINAAANNPYVFQVTYLASDPIQFSSIDDGDEIRVTGPNGFNVLASFVSSTPMVDNPTIIATYQFAPPVNAATGFDVSDNGFYIIALEGGQVFTTASKVANATTIGTFQVAFPGTQIVTNANASGPGSLRNAVTLANLNPAPDTILFDSFFNTPQTITLSGELSISGALTITGPGFANVTISGGNSNRIFNTTASDAGALITITDMTLTGGSASTGGAIEISDEAVTLERVVIDSNVAPTGGGIRVALGAASLTLRDSTISNNSSSSQGAGIVIAQNSVILVEGSTFFGNVATGGNTGGALRFVGVPQTNGFTIRNSTFYENVSGFNGGAIGFSNLGAGSVARIENSTIVNNTVNGTGRGGGIGTNAGTGTLQITNTIISGNVIGGTGASGKDIFLTTATATVNINNSAYSDTTGFTATGSNNLVGQDLKLGAAANNGGFTKTILPANDSPVIDAGTLTSPLLTDQRGLARVSGAATDIGAVEVQQAVPVVSSFTVNNGNAQRSRITTIEVTFASPVTAASFNGLGAIQLINPEVGPAGTTIQTGATGPNGLINVAQGTANSLVLTFSNADGSPNIPGVVEFGSLADGRYRLQIGSYMSDPNIAAQQIRRIFGDINGDGTVDGPNDFAAFGAVFGTTPGVSVSAFDFNNDGTIDGSTDFAQFGARFGLTI